MFPNTFFFLYFFHYLRFLYSQKNIFFSGQPLSQNIFLLTPSLKGIAGTLVVEPLKALFWCFSSLTEIKVCQHKYWILWFFTVRVYIITCEIKSTMLKRGTHNIWGVGGLFVFLLATPIYSLPFRFLRLQLIPCRSQIMNDCKIICENIKTTKKFGGAPIYALFLENKTKNYMHI